MTVGGYNRPNGICTDSTVGVGTRLVQYSTLVKLDTLGTVQLGRMAHHVCNKNHRGVTTPSHTGT